MKVADISNKIYKDLDSPSDLSLVSISFWVRNSIGQLNTLILTTFAVQNDLEIRDSTGHEINEDAACVYAQLYLGHYYDKKYRSNLTTMNNNMLLSVKDNARSVTFTNRNEIGKTILQAKKQAEEDLSKLVKGYKAKLSFPRQVVGDDVLVSITPPMTYSRS